MGGKTKQTQRTKNNAKPSSSSRSAELLGTAKPAFVGFSAHTDLGLVALAPGFTTQEHMPETFEAGLSPQLQLVLRKLAKKDPMTKKKALQEFIELINASDLETLKSTLPLWPKLYHNLANDTEHNVRELAQTVLQLLVSKCKRAVAPYLKQLVPVWLASQFDNYAPAASIASTSFRETFATNANRTQELCLHCQVEIVDYTSRNITLHTASTLSAGKNLTQEEAEQKYHRVLVCSLKELCFFLKHTDGVDIDQVKSGFRSMLTHQKFWSFAKHKMPAIKAAWFELLYQLMQSTNLEDVVVDSKSQLITVSFQNIEECDPLVAPQVWGCILHLQSTYDDWYVPINFAKSILPKISSLLRNGFNRNAQAICPNLLPFFSKFCQDCLMGVDLNEVFKQFFDDFEKGIHSINTTAKSDYASIVRAYFECMRFLLQKLNNAIQRTVEEDALAMSLLNENILAPIETLLRKENAAAKYFFLHTSALVAFWSEREDNSDNCLYTQLLHTFWTRIFVIITDGMSKNDGEYFLEQVISFINDLHLATPSLEVQKVKFADEGDSKTTLKSSPEQADKNEISAAYIKNELKQLVVQLVRICLDNVRKQESSKNISNVRRLTKMFSDADFYACIPDEKSLPAALNHFVSLIDVLDEDSSEIVMDMVFEILQKMDKADCFAYINANLLKIQRKLIQALVLQRLLSYPFCIEPEVRSMLSQPEANAVIVQTARDVIAENSKEKLNLLLKCFFQTDNGNILINQATVDAILVIMSEPMCNADLKELADMCGSFIAQIMPVICINDNSSLAVRNQIFLVLLKFTLERTPDDFISEDTFWEITTCWQDALSSEDIAIDQEMLQTCAAAVQQRVHVNTATPETIASMADALAKLITCSTENTEAEVRLQKIDDIMLTLMHSEDNSPSAVKNLSDFTVLFEALNGLVSPADVELSENSTGKCFEMGPIFRRTLLNFHIIFKLVWIADKEQRPSLNENVDEEITDDYCDPSEHILTEYSDTLITELLKCIDIAGMGDAIVNLAPQLESYIEAIALELSEKVKLFLSNSNEIVAKLQERMLQEATRETDIASYRSLLYLVHCTRYAQFEENATIILAEELSDVFLKKNALKAYVNSLQYLLPKLEQKAITIQSAIMRTEPTELWIRAAVFRCLLINNFGGETNEQSDKGIILAALNFVTEIAEMQHSQKQLLLYNTEIQNVPIENVVNALEYIYLLVEMIDLFPLELSIKNWDAIRIGLSSWVLSISKSIDNYTNPKVTIFAVAVFKLFAALANFIQLEKQKSSTMALQSVIDEWESLFAKDVNLVLFKVYYSICNTHVSAGNASKYDIAILDLIAPPIEAIDYSYVYNFHKTSQKITEGNICDFLFKNLSNTVHSVRTSCVFIFRQLAPFFIAEDIKIFETDVENIEHDQNKLTKCHFLNRFEDYIGRYDIPIRKYLKEFSFKLTEIPLFEPVNRHEAIGYLMLWDCIIYACANSPVSLRSIYTNWLNENKYEENFLRFLFRAMPAEILKNHDSKLMNSDIFHSLKWTQIKDRNLTTEKYVCHMYTEVLRKLPAVVRKWWNTSSSRQKTFVDKLTTNFVSPLICQEELKAISNKKEKHENMQVTVHTSTREVLAVYSIDEARMELVITLAQNHPLGAVKVECGKQIGGRSTSRNVGMQLTIFLTHQNGTIFDGLTLWKNNLDKKFEGVEECYVCYTVIHQDTCQLPKLTCKTCKKKFHGPCLYKWFTTSSKSTCPICRNVF